MMEDHRLSIFGSTGFIGSRFCELYPKEVVKIDREDNEAKSINILYLISTTHNYNIFDNPTLDVETNLIKLINVLEATRKRYKNNPENLVVFNFVSSWFVYGDTPLPAKEDAYCNPKGMYSITKHTAEQILISYCETFGIKYRIFRLSNVIGKGDQDVSKKKNALQYLIEEMRANRDINLYYGGLFFRDYMYVDDICRAIYLSTLCTSYDSITNIGSGNRYLFLDLMNHCKKRLNSNSIFNKVEPSYFHKIVQVKDMYLDVTKLDKFFKPQYTIFEALDKLL